VIKVSVEVRNAGTNFLADVWAQSVVRALDHVNARYPGCEVRLLLPIDPDGFFVRGRTAEGTRMVSAKASEDTGFASEDMGVDLATLSA
jgi:hypothetical protein